LQAYNDEGRRYSILRLDALCGVLTAVCLTADGLVGLGRAARVWADMACDAPRFGLRKKRSLRLWKDRHTAARWTMRRSQPVTIRVQAQPVRMEPDCGGRKSRGEAAVDLDLRCGTLSIPGFRPPRLL